MSQPLVSQVIKASAGTGKTFQLTNIYIKLLLMGVEPDRILATTFTKKAAKEIGDRIAIRLAKAGSHEEGLRELRNALEEPALEQEAVSRALRHFVESRPLTQISTFDSLCIRIVRSFTLELGLPLGWSIIDSFRESSLCDEAIGELCGESGTEELSELLQLLSQGQPLRSVHKRLRSEIFQLYENLRDIPLSAWQRFEVAPPSSTRSVGELLSLLQELEIPKTKKGEPNKQWKTAVETALFYLQSEDWRGFIKRGIANAIRENKDAFHRVKIDDVWLSLHEELLDHARYALLEKLRNQSWATKELFDRFDRLFQRRKHLFGGLSFNDVKLTLADSTVHQTLETVFYRLDNRLSHVLLDEFQDTSAKEWSVIQPLVEEVLSNTSKDRVLFCVGDPKQAIYGWRGGVAAIFDEFDRYGDAVEPRVLTKSYRSSPAIIETVNALFSQIDTLASLGDYQEAAKRWKKNFSLHETAKNEVTGYATLRIVEASPEELKEGVLYREAGEIVSELLARDPNLSIGILVRRNRGIARMIYELGQRGIRASEEGGNPLTDSTAVTLILSFLHLVDHPSDTISYFHVHNSPLRCFLEREGKCISSSELSLTYLAAIAERGLSQIVFELARHLGDRSEERERRRLSQLVSLANQFEALSFSRLRDFPQYVREQKVEDVQSASVRVMTIHQSKGLEFDIVILPELDKPFWKKPASSFLYDRPSPLSKPSLVVRSGNQEIRSLDKNLERLEREQSLSYVEEELCVLYVAMTRARYGMYLLSRHYEKTRPPSHGGLLCEALGKEARQSGEIYHFGDLSFLGRTAPLQNEKESVEESRPNLDFSTPRKRFFPRIQPSEKPSSLPRLTVSSSDVEHRLIGSMIHRCLESIVWIEDGLQSAQSYQILCENLCHDQTLRERAVHRFLTALEQPDLKAVLSLEETQTRFPMFEVSVEREYPFFIRQSESLLSGTIDRLHLYKENGSIKKIELFDFKTGNVHQTYQEQLDQYQSAVASLYGLTQEQVATKLLFLSPCE